MGWRIIYIEESEYLNLYLDNIKIKRNGSDVLIPISDIHTLIIDNYKSVLSVNLLNKCSKEKVNVILCGIDHLPQTIIYPISGNNQTPKILKAQFQWSENTKGLLQQTIVKGKIKNQRRILELNKKDKNIIAKLKTFEEEVKPFDSTNREGLSAKIYFRTLFGKGFIRFHEDPINAALNYGYSIIRSQISKVLIANGLNTSIGIFHKGPNNTFNLSDDIIEVFRPIVDNYVCNNIQMDTLFSREHRISLIKLTTKKLLYNGQKHTFFNVVNMYVRNIHDCFKTGNLELIIPNIVLYDK